MIISHERIPLMKIKVALAKSGNHWQVYGSSAEPIEETTDIIKEDASKWIGQPPEISILELELPIKQDYTITEARKTHDSLLKQLGENFKLLHRSGSTYRIMERKIIFWVLHDDVGSVCLQTKTIQTTDENRAKFFSKLNGFNVVLDLVETCQCGPDP